MFTSWKTSLGGVATIIFAGLGVATGHLTWAIAGPMIVAGITGIFAKDHDK